MNKPSKPYPEFPLFAHSGGQWRKDVRIAGKVKAFYFGPWSDDPRGERAVKDWLARQDGIRAGLDHTRVAAATAVTLGEMLRQFLTFKQGEYQANRIAGETFRDYTREANHLGKWAGQDANAAAFGPGHFGRYRQHMEASRKLGPNRLAVNIFMVKAMFHYAAGMGLIPAPVFGPGFVPPATDPDAKAAAKLRKGQRVEDAPIWQGPEVEWLLANSDAVMRAAILVALNCGMGPSDLARLRWRNIKGKRLTMRRGKNGIRREGYLWKRTREALDKLRTCPHQTAAITRDGDDALVFLNKAGRPIVDRVDYRDAADPAKIKAVKVSASFSKRFGALVRRGKEAGVIRKDAKLVFYNFRHTFYSHAEGVTDLNALHRAVGHALAGQGKVYHRKGFPLGRLKRLAVRVKAGVWPKPKTPKPNADGRPQMRLVG